MIITIDGPAGAGKSTVAKLLAQRLSGRTPCEYLDTGSMYRAVALAGIRRNVDWNIPERLEEVANCVSINVWEARTFLDGEDVTERVRSPEVTEKTRFSANNPAIREIMVRLQQQIGKRYLLENKSLVTEGRDQGTIVFPDADFKFFITATPEERARRRFGEMRRRGESGDLNEILQAINLRDAQDSSRKVGPLREPDDAHRVVTDGMEIDEVVRYLIRIIEKNN